MNEQLLEFMKNISEPFNSVIRLCYEYEPRVDSDDDIFVKIDKSYFDIKSNSIFMNKGRILPVRLASILSDIRNIYDNDTNVVTYSFYPGIYTFLLSPFIFDIGEKNFAYFGNEALDVVSTLDTGPVVGPIRKTLVKNGQRYVLNRADVTFVRNPKMVNYQYESKIIESKPISKFDTYNTDLQDINVEEDTVRLLFVASFREHKGHQYMLNALAKLAEQDQREYKLILVGDGEYKPEMEQLATSLGISDQVDFIGYVKSNEKLEKIYRNCDIFVLPSLYEGFPRVLNEAMAFGLPIVATTVGGIPNVLNDRESAILIEPETPDSIVSGITEVVNNPELRTRLRENAYEVVQWYLEGSPSGQHLEEIRDSFDE